MFTMSAQQTAVVATGKYSAFIRAQVQDVGGTYRNLASAYGGWDFLESVTHQQTLDDVPATFDVELKREIYEWSLAQLMTSSPINLTTYLTPGSGYSPLLDAARKFKLEFAIIPLDGQPQPSDWTLLVEGYIDEVDSGDSSNAHVTGRDLSAKLADTFIEDERVYGLVSTVTSPGPFIWNANTTYNTNDLALPTVLNGHYYKITGGGGSSSGTTEPIWPTSGGSIGDGGLTWTDQGSGAVYPGTGIAVETVMQTIISDAGLANTLSVPVSPGWNILTFKQQRQSVLDAVRALAQQIGWDLRYFFKSGAGAFTFYQPTRASPSVQYTFQPGVVFGVKKLSLNVQGIRNVVRVVYNDSQDLDLSGWPKRKYVQVSDSTSISRFGRRFMEIAEDFTSKIDTVGEATTMATACLNDLSSPIADVEVEVPFFPFAEIGDYYTFKADNLHFDVDESFGIVGVQHNFTKEKARTTLTCRGKPAGGYKSWHDISVAPNYGRPGMQLSSHALQGVEGALTVGTVATVTGVRMGPAFLHTKESAWDGFEYHLSTSNASPPSSGTLIGAGRTAAFEAHGLNPNIIYYWSAVPYRMNAGKIIRGQPTSWQQVTPMTLNPLHINPNTAWTDQPPNADFGSWTAGSGGPPDRWTMNVGTWGTNAVRDASTIFDGLYSINVDSTADLLCDYFPVKPLTDYFFDTAYRNSDNVGRPQLTVNWYSAIGALLSTNAGTAPTIGSGSWSRYSFRQTAPTNAALARVDFKSAVLLAGKNLWIGYCRAMEVRTQEPWNVVGAAGQPAFSANWTNFGGGFASTAFFKDLNGIVHLKGTVSATAAQANGNNIFTIPAGYRPLQSHQFCGKWNGGGVDKPGIFQVSSAGAVTILQALANGDNINIDCTFLGEQ